MCVVRTYSGNNVNLINPDPTTISILDIAHHLANTTRYNGATHWPYSVAQHSLYVASICSPENRLAGLMHDATEAYLGDVVAPLKGLLPGYKAIEQTMAQTIAGKFHFEWPRDHNVEWADKTVLKNEMRDILGWHDLVHEGDYRPSEHIQIVEKRSEEVRQEFLLRFFDYFFGTSHTITFDDGEVFFNGKPSAGWVALTQSFGLHVAHQAMMTGIVPSFRIPAFGTV